MSLDLQVFIEPFNIPCKIRNAVVHPVFIIIIIGTADQQPHVFCKFLAAFGIIFSLCIDCSLFCLITLTGEAG